MAVRVSRLPSRRMPWAPSVFDGVSHHSRISHAGMSPAPLPAPSTLPRLARRLDGVAGVPRPSRSGLGVCLGPRPSSFASLVIQRRCESLARLSRSSRVGGVRLSRRRPSHAALVAATALLAFRALRVPIRRVPQAPSGSRLGMGLRRRPSSLRRSSLWRRPKSLPRLSRNVSSARASRTVDLPSPRSSPRRRGLRSASLAFPSRRVPRDPSIFVRFARHHGGVANHSHVPRACVSSLLVSRAVDFPSRRSLPRRHCLRSVSCAFLSWRVPQRRRSSPVSLVAMAASQPRFLRSRVGGARLPRHLSSLASQVATRALPAFCVSHTPHLGVCHNGAACASRLSRLRTDVTLDAAGLHSLRSSSQQRRESLAHLSRSHAVGMRLPRRQPYPALLLLTQRC